MTAHQRFRHLYTMAERYADARRRKRTHLLDETEALSGPYHTIVVRPVNHNLVRKTWCQH